MIRARVSDQMLADGIAVVVLMEDSAGGKRVLHIDGDGVSSWDEVSGLLVSAPTLTLENEVARALLDALLRHYQGASDMHTVRADLLHERQRVDKLTDAVIRIAGKEA